MRNPRNRKLILGCLIPLSIICILAIVCVRSVGIGSFLPKIPNPFAEMKSLPTIQAELDATQKAMIDDIQFHLTTTPFAVPTIDPKSLPTMAPTPELADLQKKIDEMKLGINQTATAMATALVLPTSTPIPASIELPKIWVVKNILGDFEIPGVGKRTEIEFAAKGNSSQVRIAYCLDPGKPIPQIGKECDYIQDFYGPGIGQFSCGKKLQKFRELP